MEDKDKILNSEVKIRMDDLLYANKRITREYHSLIKTYDNIEVFYNYHLCLISLVIYSNTEKIPEYKFTMNENYPYIPPIIYYKSKKYFSFLQMPSQRFKHTLKQLTGKECLCCDSFSCREKWTPFLTLTHIIEEINNIKKIKKNIILKILIEQIKKTYLIHDIDVCSYVF